MGVGRRKWVPKKERSNYQPDKWYPKRYVPKAIQEEVMERDGGHCQVCGSEKDLCFVHRVPLSRGGMTLIWNIALYCTQCKRNKQNSTPKEFMNDAYFKFSVLKVKMPGEDPVILNILFTDGTILEGFSPEDPTTSKGDYYVYLNKSSEAKVLVPREKVKAIAIIPESMQPDADVAHYLEKSSS